MTKRDFNSHVKPQFLFTFSATTEKKIILDMKNCNSEKMCKKYLILENKINSGLSCD